MARMSKRPDGRYVVRVVTPEGPRYAYGKTQSEARAKAQAMRDRLKAGAPVRDASRTLGDWCEEWIAASLEASSRSRGTKIIHAGYARHWILPTLGTVPLGKLNPADVTRLVLAMQQAGKAQSTVRNCYTTLRLALDDAVSNGLLGVDPV